MSDKWSRSRQWLERARQSLPLGVSSPFRARFPVPLYFARGSGPYLTDVDGNRYVDYTLGWGPNILGYAHPALVAAVTAQAARGHNYGAQHELEFLVAEKIRELVPCAGRVIFSSSGSEAVQLALRLARAFTGRNLILKFEGHYHGWMDSVLISHHPAAGALGSEEAPCAVLESRGQVPNAADNVIVAVWNRVEAVEAAFARAPAPVAGVIMEPVLCNSGCLMPRPGYLEAVRDICRREGALLIFDEVITGFRMALGGAQEYYGVQPDLAIFGKALGGGLPVSAVAGRPEIMDLIGDGVAFGGSFNGNPLVLAAAHATLGELSRDQGAALERANRTGRTLMDGIRDAARRCGIPVVVSGFGAAFAVHFTEKPELRDYRDALAGDPQRLARFALALLERGVYILPDGRFYVSVVHGPEEMTRTLEAVESALVAVR